MTSKSRELSPMAQAKTAGLLYLIIAMFGMFSIGYVPATIFVFGDAATTANNIAAHQGLFRLGIFADMVVIVCEIFITGILYTLFKPVNKTLSVIAALSRFGMIVVMGLNLINYLVPLVLLSGANYLQSFDTNQLQSLAMLFLDAHEFGVYVWQIFFGMHLLALGYLVFKSGYVPRLLGTMMMVGSFGYSVQALEKLVLPGNSVTPWLVIGLLTIVTIGEFSFALWLLFKGVNVEKWRQWQPAE